MKKKSKMKRSSRRLENRLCPVLVLSLEEREETELGSIQMWG